jgi:hypothetical protein
MLGFRHRGRPACGFARVAAWNTKVLGAVLARQCYEAGLAGPHIPLMAHRPTAGRSSSRRKRHTCGRWWKTVSPHRSG